MRTQLETLVNTHGYMAVLSMLADIATVNGQELEDMADVNASNVQDMAVAMYDVVRQFNGRVE